MKTSDKEIPSVIARLSSILVLLSIAFAARAEFPQPVLEAAYQRVTPSVCVVSYSYEITNPATGQRDRNNTSTLGLIVSKEGLVLVRGHVEIENVDPFNLRVTIGEGEAEKGYDAVLLKKPDDVNVALVKIAAKDGETFPFTRFATDYKGKLGDTLCVIGVYGTTLDNARGVQLATVSSILKTPRTSYCLGAALPAGFVGGPCIDAQGRVVGVTGYDLSQGEGGDLYVRSGHPLLYQASLFQKHIDTPPSKDDVSDTKGDAWLGVFTQPLTDELAEYWGLPKEGGIVLSTLVPGSPAAAAGMQRGDVIVAFNGIPVRAKQDREVLDFTKLVRDAGVGMDAAVDYLRNGERQTLTIPLVARPKAAKDADEFVDEVFGLTVRELTTDVRVLLNILDDVEGAIVRSVKSGSWADLAGMRPGLIVMRFGEYPVTSLEEFELAVRKVAEEKPGEVTVFCRLGDRTGFFRIEPRWE